MTPCLTGKTRYENAGQAHDAIRGMKRDGRLRRHTIDDIEPFWCSGCGGYHLGNRTAGDRRRQRRAAPDRRKADRS